MDLPERIAGQRLDLDDIGAEVTEHDRCRGGGDVAGAVDNLQSPKDALLHGLFPPARSLRSRRLRDLFVGVRSSDLTGCCWLRSMFAAGATDVRARNGRIAASGRCAQ